MFGSQSWVQYGYRKRIHDLAMINTYSSGEGIKQRRNALKLIQRELAGSAFCSLAMVKKIEVDERLPRHWTSTGLPI